MTYSGSLTAAQPDMVAAALTYAAAGWPVFPISPQTKKPYRGTHGFKDATADLEKVKALWQGRTDANIGLGTARIVVLDADGREGIAQFRDLGEGPATRVGVTPRGGLHFFYRAPQGVEVRSWNASRAAKGGPGLDVKGVGGYVLLPPSRTVSGSYRWLRGGPLAELAGAQLAYALKRNGNGLVHPPGGATLQIPEHLRNFGGGRDLLAAASERLEWTAHNEARVAGALKAITDDAYDNWIKVGAALHHLEWTMDGVDAGFLLWDQWSRRFSSHYTEGLTEQKWATFGREVGSRVSIASVFAMAQEAGWQGELGENVTDWDRKNDDKNGQQNSGAGGGFNGAPAATPRTARSIMWADGLLRGQPRPTRRHARLALEALHLDCRYDVFHEKLLVDGSELRQWGGELTKHVTLKAAGLISQYYQFEPPTNTVEEAIVQLAIERRFDPLLDYIDGLKWDGTLRLDNWLNDYCAAERTLLNAEIGKLILIAAVRRARQPGCKFDHIIVLEGGEDKYKSTLIRLLAGGDEFYSDQPILHVSDKEQQEKVQGVWLYEIGELEGLGKAETEKTKGFVTRTVDRCRPAYGHTRVDKPRRCVFFATTNEDTYLRSQTGNRRFLPVKIGHIKIVELEAIRDQLWAEAAEREKTFGWLVLSDQATRMARGAQRERMEHDPLEDILASVTGRQTQECGPTERRVSTAELFTQHLDRINIQLNTNSAKRVAHAMHNLGWQGPMMLRMDKIKVRGYARALKMGSTTSSTTSVPEEASEENIYGS